MYGIVSSIVVTSGLALSTNFGNTMLRFVESLFVKGINFCILFPDTTNSYSGWFLSSNLMYVFPSF